MFKNISYFLSVVLMGFALNAQSQSDNLEIYNVDGEMLANGTELLSFAHLSSTKILQTDSLVVKNTSNQVINLIVRKNEVDVLDGSFNLFSALAQSVPASESVTPNSWELFPGETLPIEACFKGSYYHQQVKGISTIQYSFISLGFGGEVVDSVYVTYHFLNTSVTPMDLDNNVFINKEVLVTGDASATISYPVKLFNHSSNDVNIRVLKEVLENEDEHQVYFRYGGTEFSAEDSISTNGGYKILSGDTLVGDYGFTALFDANDVEEYESLTKVNFTFYNVINRKDKSAITLAFNPIGTGFEEINEYQISKPYPNPAKGYFSLDHQISSGMDAVLKVYNSLGVLIINYPISNGQKSSTLSTVDWNAGVYYISIEIDGKLFGTEKVIIE